MEDEYSGEQERSLIVQKDAHPSKIAVFFLNTTALLYGGVTGFVVLNGVIATAPVPIETVDDTFFILVGGAIASVGIINLNRQHIMHAAHELINSNVSLGRSLLRNICGHDQLPFGLSVFNTTLKIAGAVAESCIAYAVVRQILQHTPALSMPLSILFAASAFLGFPSVEGGALTKNLKGEFSMVNSSGEKITITINSNVFKKIFFSELVLFEAIHQYETNLVFAKQRQAAYGQGLEGPQLILPSMKLRVIVNIITLFGSLCVGGLAFLDIRALCGNNYYGYSLGALIAVLYVIADVALRGNEAKRKLYQMPSEEKDSDIEAIKHAPFATIFALIQSFLLALIPFMVMLELLYFNDSHVHAEQMGIYQLLCAVVFAIPKLITSFLVEGLGLIHNFTHKDGGPLFSSLFNIVQFATPALCVSLYEIWQDNYSPATIAIIYSIIGGANLFLSTVRHCILRLVDKNSERTFYSTKAMIAWVLTNTLVPLSGGVFQALLQYILLASETGDKAKQETGATLGGFVVSGLACVLTRVYANKNSLFYKKDTTLLGSTHVPTMYGASLLST